MTLPVILAVAVMAMPLLSATDAIARGGGAWLDSPGYQRALAASRKKLKQDLDQQNEPIARRRKRK